MKTAVLAVGAVVTALLIPVDAQASPDEGWSVAVDAPEYAVSGLPGDDNHDGVIDEDESGWNCAIMGNRVCGVK